MVTLNFKTISFLFFLFSTLFTSADSVLITGANRGLGLELCKQFINDGYTVYGTARKPETAT